MAGYTYKIESFAGLDQSRGENLISPAYSPDAMNMDTSEGELEVTRGYVKHLPAAVPAVANGVFDSPPMEQTAVQVPLE